MPVLIRIDAASTTPIYRQIADAVTAQVAVGSLPAGTRLLPARDLAEVLGVNVHTVLHGYRMLREAGVIELRRGRGAIVLGPTRGRVSAALAAYIDQAKQAGLSAAEAAALVEKGM